MYISLRVKPIRNQNLKIPFGYSNIFLQTLIIRIKKAKNAKKTHENFEIK